jgi:hypothetical protein
VEGGRPTASVIMATDRHRLSVEEHLGREEGEAFDRCLREAERAEREDRLSRIAWGGYGSSETGIPVLPAAVEEPDRRAPAAIEVLELEREVQRLTHFHDAVQRSRAWRMTQRLRRMVGREW